MKQCFTCNAMIKSRMLALIFILVFSITSNGQTHQKGLDKLPADIKASFINKYPASSEENWSLTEHTILISFKSGNDYCDAFFDEKGKWQRTEKSILYDQLPKAIQDSLNTGEFSSWEKGSVYEVELPGTSGNFKIYVYSKDWNEMELNFDKRGKRLL